MHGVLEYVNKDITMYLFCIVLVLRSIALLQFRLSFSLLSRTCARTFDRDRKNVAQFFLANRVVSSTVTQYNFQECSVGDNKVRFG